MLNKLSIAEKTITYAKRTGLRSMQNIPEGAERCVIEAHKNELTHEVWGNPEKLKEWVLSKIEQLINADYVSELLDRNIVENSRNELVKAWGNLVKQDFKTSKNPFMQLKILDFITGNLRKNNKSLAPILRVDVFQDALAISKKTGKSFKKVYTGLLKDTKYHKINVAEENVQTESVRGTWYTLRTLNKSESVKSPVLAQKIQDFIMSISTGSDWCIRNRYRLNSEYMGTKFHIFVDDKGIPQLCLTAVDDAGKVFSDVRGKEQYKTIPKEYKEVLNKFLEKHNLTDSLVLDNEGFTSRIIDLCK